MIVKATDVVVIRSRGACGTNLAVAIVLRSAIG